MSKVLVEFSDLSGMVSALRQKTGGSTLYKPSEMAAAIRSIEAYPEPTGSVNITANGTHDVKGKASAVVDVRPVLQSKTTTQNGTVTPDVGYDGLGQVVVDVSGGGGDAALLMSQGQVSTTSAYATAYFDSSIDLTAYDRLIVDIYRNGSIIGISTLIPSSFPLNFNIYSSSYTYAMQLTASSIACTHYSGSYVDLYVNVYGVNI